MSGESEAVTGEGTLCPDLSPRRLNGTGHDSMVHQ